jgi:hypothetical protein
LELLLIAAEMILLLRKKSVATMFALSHQISVYQLFTCLRRVKGDFRMDSDPLIASTGRGIIKA